MNSRFTDLSEREGYEYPRMQKFNTNGIEDQWEQAPPKEGGGISWAEQISVNWLWASVFAQWLQAGEEAPYRHLPEQSHFSTSSRFLGRLDSPFFLLLHRTALDSTDLLCGCKAYSRRSLMLPDVAPEGRYAPWPPWYRSMRMLCECRCISANTFTRRQAPSRPVKASGHVRTSEPEGKKRTTIK